LTERRELGLIVPSHLIMILKRIDVPCKARVPPFPFPEDEPMANEKIQPLAVRAATAAAMLNISQRTLYTLSRPRGPIRCTKLSDGPRAHRLYRVADLDAFLRGEPGTDE
jgi:hypothetical protein